jgi:hypothetical protein
MTTAEKIVVALLLLGATYANSAPLAGRGRLCFNQLDWPC